MDKEEKMSKMYNYCRWKQCSNCKVDKENPSHECGGGKGYSMDYNIVSNKELDMNYKIAFGEIKEEEKKVNKFKVGDVVRIIKNVSSHCFEIGDIVELYEKSSDGYFRGRKEVDSRDLGNWIGQEEMELIEENKLTTKTITITTSDSTTTLTDGTHTTSINRYYADKHDERVAVNEVVKKYYDELDEIGRVSKEKHLFDDEANYYYGVIGTPTILTDSIGRKLFIGDVVKVYNKDGSDNGFMDLVCHDDEDGDFIMGCACATSNNSKKEYNYLKEMSYGDISNDNKIWDSCLVIK